VTTGDPVEGVVSLTRAEVIAEVIARRAGDAPIDEVEIRDAPEHELRRALRVLRRLALRESRAFATSPSMARGDDVGRDGVVAHPVVEALPLAAAWEEP
jgi:hypothetical protein